MNKELTVITIDTTSQLTLEEVCELYHVTPDWISELISYGVIEPGHSSVNAILLRRIKRIVRLQKDLEVNLAGAILALELIDQITDLKTQVELFEKHLRL